MTRLPTLLSTVILTTAAAAGWAAPDALVLTPAQRRAAGVQLARPGAALVPSAAASGAVQGLVLQGTVVAPPQATELVSAPLAGVVQSVRVNQADAVQAGQALVRLHSPALMAMQREYLQLQLQAEQADERLRRDERLADDGIIATARVHETRNTAQQARLGAQERRQALRLAGLTAREIQALVATAQVQPALTVAATARGQVAEVMVQPGQQVEAGAPLLRVARPLPLGLALQATPAQAAQLRTGAAVRLQHCDLAGTVRGIVPAMQGSNQAVIVQVALARADACVQPNQAVSAQVALGAAASGAVRLPAAALWQIAGRNQVFVDTVKGLRPQPVSLLAREGAQVVVSGVGADAAVAVAGVAALKGAWLGLGDAAAPAAAPPAAASAAAAPASAGAR